jgi:predicted RNA polymerase sigma factor
MTRRISRAKDRIRAAGTSFSLPPESGQAPRLTGPFTTYYPTTAKWQACWRSCC